MYNWIILHTGSTSGVARVSSARGPMLASVPPPPELAPPLPHRPTRLAPLGLGVRPPPPLRLVKPASAPGKKIDKQKKKKKVFSKKKELLLLG